MAATDPTYKRHDKISNTLICEECGSLIHIELRSAHDRFHSTFDIINQESARLSRAATRSSRR